MKIKSYRATYQVTLTVCRDVEAPNDIDALDDALEAECDVEYDLDVGEADIDNVELSGLFRRTPTGRLSEVDIKQTRKAMLVRFEKERLKSKRGVVVPPRRKR